MLVVSLELTYRNCNKWKLGTQKLVEKEIEPRVARDWIKYARSYRGGALKSPEAESMGTSGLIFLVYL